MSSGWARGARWLVEINKNMAELCVNPDSIEAFSSTHSWDPAFKKSSSHASNYFASFLFPTASFFAYYLIQTPVTRTRWSVSGAPEHTNKHSRRKDGTWLRDLSVNLRLGDRDGADRQVDTAKRDEIRSFFWHSLQGSNRILKDFFFLHSKQVYCLPFFFSDLSKHLQQRLNSRRANTSNPRSTLPVHMHNTHNCFPDL